MYVRKGFSFKLFEHRQPISYLLKQHMQAGRQKNAAYYHKQFTFSAVWQFFELEKNKMMVKGCD